MTSTNKDAALALVALGYRIFPCNVDKTPRVKAWEQAASSSPFSVGLQWDQHPEAMPAIPVGAHGLVVFDCDRKPNRADGVLAFESLCREHAVDLSTAFAVMTPSGGVHFYFRTEAAYGNSAGAVAPGVDVRGKGGYVIAPGSVLPDGGGCYRHVHGSWAAIPALPDSLATLLRPKAPLPIAVALGGSTPTERDRAYAASALGAEVSKLAAMSKGSGRNNALNVAAHSLGTLVGNGSLDYAEASTLLYSASVTNGYIAKDGEATARATIESGLKSGISKPRALFDVADVDIDVDTLISKGQSSNAPKANGKRSVKLMQGSAIEAKPITWLWDGYLPVGKLALLAGAGGTGKSTLAFSIAATITTGGLWPDGSRCNALGNVLIWSSEDDPSDTIKPRLMAAGADDARYGVISGVTNEAGETCPFDAATDMQHLREAVTGIGGISLLIIDPIVTAVTGDMHKANDVRRSLQPIVDFAAEMNCAVLGITHFAKGTGGKNSAERVIGSQAFAALARMVLVAAKEEDSDRRVFTRAKANNTVDTGGFSYSIEVVTLERDIVATRVLWGEALEGSSRSILSEVEEGEASDDDTSKLGQAKRFLMDSLATQAVGSKELFRYAREGYGISEKTLRRAGKALNIQPQHAPLFEGGWSWALPVYADLMTSVRPL